MHRQIKEFLNRGCSDDSASKTKRKCLRKLRSSGEREGGTGGGGVDVYV
jgi:hypothetical protein